MLLWLRLWLLAQHVLATLACQAEATHQCDGAMASEQEMDACLAQVSVAASWDACLVRVTEQVTDADQAVVIVAPWKDGRQAQASALAVPGSVMVALDYDDRP